MLSVSTRTILLRENNTCASTRTAIYCSYVWHYLASIPCLYADRVDRTVNFPCIVGHSFPRVLKYAAWFIVIYMCLYKYD